MVYAVGYGDAFLEQRLPLADFPSSRRFLSVRSIPIVQEKRSVLTTHNSFIHFVCKLFDPDPRVKFYGKKKAPIWQ